MAVYKRGRVWWYKFTWNGEPIRESTKQTNKRVAEQIEAAHKTSLAKGEVGLHDRVAAATIRNFAKTDFLPFCRSTFAAKIKTLSYYENGTARLLEYSTLADESLDTITTEKIAGYARRRQDAGMKVSTVNRELQVLRRMFALATEWGKVQRVLPRVRMIPGEAHRDRVVSVNEEKVYFDAAQAVGIAVLAAYERALVGIRASKRGQSPIKPRDPFLLRDVATILLDCGIRPEECFRLRWQNYQGDVIEITRGKTDHARRRIPLSQRAQSILDMRRGLLEGPWIFPAQTKSGHIEPSSLQDPHAKACKLAKIEHFPLYTFRHTCLTRWAPFMDPWTLAYLAGHRDMSITKRYVHPQEYNTRAAMEKARLALGGHSSGHSPILNTQLQIGDLALSS
ncbi:MAG TPA: tyrosine-type recombinase/integrase [Bryobacteraceae bacterium]|jgi:integrase